MIQFKDIQWHDLPLDYVNIRFDKSLVEIGFNVFNEIRQDYDAYIITAKQVSKIDFENNHFPQITNNAEINDAKLEKLSDVACVLEITILFGESLPSSNCKIEAREIVIDIR